MTDLETLIKEIEKEFPDHLWFVCNHKGNRYFANITPFNDGNGGAYAPTSQQALMGARMQARNAKQESSNEPTS